MKTDASGDRDKGRVNVKITLVLPQQDMVDVALKTISDHNSANPTEEKGGEEYKFQILVTVLADDIIAQLEDSDVVIARGATAHAIKSRLPHVSVVEIPISGYDILSTIHHISAEQGDVLIGFVGTNNMLNSTANVARFLGSRYRQYPFENNEPDLVDQTVSLAVSDGCQAIIGGIDTCTCARQYGVAAYPIPTSYESIWQAISEAKHNASFRHEERAKAVKFQMLLDYAYEGIIATDREGKITTFNTSAEKILNVSAAAAVERDVAAVFPNCRLGTILRDGHEYYNEIIPHKKHQLSINKIMMKLNGEIIGNIVTFQDIASIQKAERIIRDKICSRGHIARYTFADIVGRSQSLQELVNTAKVYAKASSNILIIGESGTGKELFAQSIHNESEQKRGPFVAVNCAALPPSLLESELFGYVEGAFTGASRGGKPGLFELAHGGTIFLDEISEMPIDLQGRLLRVIQEREIMRLGHDRVTPVDVRVISATNKPLAEMVRRKAFRQDLYYRLNVLTLRLVPLRERKEDIMPLVYHCLSQYNKESTSKIKVSPEAEKMLCEYDWEGNVREIRNICEHLCILNRNGVITPENVRNALPEKNTDGDSVAAGSFSPAAEFEQFERHRIIQALEELNFDRGEVAQKLGYSRTTLWRRMKALGISVPKYNGN